MTDPTPSDRAPDVLAHGSTDVSACVVSMSARSPTGGDAEYLRWHALDHLPEQYRLAGVRAGTRWVSTPACRAVRRASSRRFDAVDHVVQYLFADPLDEAMATFFGLGADLGKVGRMPVRLPSVELGGYRRTGGVAAPDALVGVDVLPWRPATGVFLVVEDGQSAPADALTSVAGVAGAWQYSGSNTMHPSLAATEGLHLTVCFLDDDPIAAVDRLAHALTARWESGTTVPLLAAPFVTVVPYAWDRVLPA